MSRSELAKDYKNDDPSSDLGPADAGGGSGRG